MPSAPAQLGQPPQQDYARMVAGQFVQQYYHVLKSYSKHLHRFYMEDSSFTISGKEGLAESKTAKGGAIQCLLTDLMPEAQADCQTFEAQPVCAPGYTSQDPYYSGTPILIQTAGALTTSGKRYSFTQTFLLAPFGGANRGPGYYVANDILCLAHSDTCPAAENGHVPPPASDVPDRLLKAALAPQTHSAAPAAQAQPQQEGVPTGTAITTHPEPQVDPPAPANDKPANSQASHAASATAAAAAASSPGLTCPSPPHQPTASPPVTLQASPSPSPAANLTWSERLKLSAKSAGGPTTAAPAKATAAATAAITPPANVVPQLAPVPVAPIPTLTPGASTPSSAAEPSPAPAVPALLANGLPAPHNAPGTPSMTVMMQDLPECSAQAVLDLLCPFGHIKGGAEAITIRPYKDRFTAYFDFETREALEAAVAAELYLQGSKVRVVEKRGLRRDSGRGRSGRYGGRSGSGGERRSDSFERRGPTLVANGGSSAVGERPLRGGRGGYQPGGDQRAEANNNMTEGAEGAERLPRREAGRGEGARGRRGRGSSSRGRGRSIEGRAGSPATAPAAGGAAATGGA